jgi:hypothetical protein
MIGTEIEITRTTEARMQRRGGLEKYNGKKRGLHHHYPTDVSKSSQLHQAYWKECAELRELTPEMGHMDRPRIRKGEHEKRKHKLSHHEQQDLIATPWQIWERKETNEYTEPEYYEEEEETEEREGDKVWIGSGVIEKERERQDKWCGSGSSKENGDDMMRRAAITNKKRRQAIIDNEEAVHAYRREVHKQGYAYRNYTNTEQSWNERLIRVTYKDAPDLMVPIDNSSTTSGIFAANRRTDRYSTHTHKHNDVV